MPICLYVDGYGTPHAQDHATAGLKELTSRQQPAPPQPVQPLDITTLLVPQTALHQTLQFTFNIPPTC
jgi:hypothetical protein